MKRPYKVWTEKDVIYLRNNYAHTDIRILSTILKRSPENIYSYAYKFDLVKPRQKKWTIKEEDFLRENYTKYPIKLLCLRNEKKYWWDTN